MAEALKCASLNINAVEFVPPVVTGGAGNHAHMNGHGAHAVGINHLATLYMSTLQMVLIPSWRPQSSSSRAAPSGGAGAAEGGSVG